MVFIKYSLVAGVVYGIDFGGYILLLSMGNSAVVANTLIKVVALVFGFFAHRYFTYSITERNNMGKHAVRYFGLGLIYTPVSSMVLYVLMFLVTNPIYAKLITDISLFAASFWVTSNFSFSKTHSTSTKR